LINLPWIATGWRQTIYIFIYKSCLNAWVYLVQWEMSFSREPTGKNYFRTKKQNCITSRIATFASKRRECICWIDSSFRIKLCRISLIINCAIYTYCILLLISWLIVLQEAAKRSKTWLKKFSHFSSSISKSRSKTLSNFLVFLARTVNILIQFW